MDGSTLDVATIEGSMFASNLNFAPGLGSIEAHGGQVGAQSAASEHRIWFSLPA